MNKEQEKSIKQEIQHIFDSGANEIRIFDMIDRLFVQSVNTGRVEPVIEIKCSNRYFLVSYMGTVKTGALTGSILFTTEGNYLNKKETISQLELQNIKLDLRDIVITNVIEISRDDYHDWINKE